MKIPVLFKKILIVLGALFLLNGCFPSSKTVQPHLTFELKDTEGVPINNAQLLLKTYRSPPGYFPPAEHFVSEANGRIVVPEMTQWENNMMFLHGVNFYSWAWCITAPGYTGSEGHISSADKIPTATIKLVLEKSSESKTCSFMPD